MTDTRARDWADAGNLPADEPETSLSTTLMRGLEVLECFAGDERLTNAELARRTGLNKPTITRLCKTLVKMGYLRRDTEGGFRLAPRILTLAYPVLAAARWRHDAHEMMAEIARMTGGAVTLSVISGPEFVTVQSVGEARHHPHVPDIGISGPLVGSATGRALLSLLDGQELSDKLAECRAADPAGYARNAAAMTAAVDRCRRDGFCTAFGEWRPTIFAAAAPVGISPDGLPVALVCAVPSYRTTRDAIDTDLGPRLRDAAETLRHAGDFVRRGR
ncbi:MAG: IclR family transcriptional regulator [Rhodobacter sp.]|nr:IclR family transcriptional regulator [Paracoccaceae bacterium]MCC0076572.1 IclR family transcriptional regulator [Rhodobacter sp.]